MAGYAFRTNPTTTVPAATSCSSWKGRRLQRELPPRVAALRDPSSAPPARNSSATGRCHVDGARSRWSPPAKGATSSTISPREGASDPALVSMMNVFRKTPEGMFHTWGSELVSHRWKTAIRVTWTWCGRSGTCMTPDGRGDLPIAIQNYEHAYFSQHVLGGES